MSSSCWRWWCSGRRSLGQNVLLQAVAMELAGVPIGAFSNEKVAQVLELKAGEDPMYIIAIGRPPAR